VSSIISVAKSDGLKCIIGLNMHPGKAYRGQEENLGWDYLGDEVASELSKVQNSACSSDDTRKVAEQLNDKLNVGNQMVMLLLSCSATQQPISSVHQYG
jgi:hypothetical protein